MSDFLYGKPRRKLIWARIRGPREGFALWLATASGAGLLPLAPGTMGTLVGVPIAYLTNTAWGVPARLALWIGLTIIGTWSAMVFDQLMGSKDNQNIVIDEVVGLGITAWTAGQSPLALGAAFVLFRFFDVLKPPPVRQVDAWSHRGTSPWLGGFGVMADDIVAGFQGLAVMLLLQRFGILP